MTGSQFILFPVHFSTGIVLFGLLKYHYLNKPGRTGMKTPKKRGDIHNKDYFWKYMTFLRITINCDGAVDYEPRSTT